jgi:redox-sensing transcriptional repressor
MITIPERSIERLCAYRRILRRWHLAGKRYFHSHELADEAGITSAQVRRDLMSLNTPGTPKRGYLTDKLIRELDLIIAGEGGQRLILVGAGKLGSAIASHLCGMLSDISIVAVFETDPAKIGTTIDRVPCLPLDELDRVVRGQGVLTAILALPGSAAQDVTTRLVDSGVRALVNFSGAKLKTPPGVFVQDVDISLFVDKSAYFARVLAGSVAPAELAGSNKRILYFGDDQRDAEHYRNVLGQFGYDFQAGSDCATCAPLALSCQPDLIVIDGTCSSADSYQVAGMLRADASLRFTPILMFVPAIEAGHPDGEFSGIDRSLPVDALLEQPAATPMLIAAVRRLLGLPRNQINVEGGIAIARLPSHSFAA